MRIITEKDIKGLATALRVFVRALSGEVVPTASAVAMLQRAVNEGITFDQIFNKENWGRVLVLYPSLTAQDYIESMCLRQIDVRSLKDEANWFEPDNGMKVITEAAHDFYLTVSGRGGKWNLPSAMTNLARAIQIYSLEAILSEKLIQEVNNARKGEQTFFDYIQLLVQNVNEFHVDTEPTEATSQREEEAGSIEEAPVDENDIHTETNQPEDDPYPDDNNLSGGFETTFLMPQDPREFKMNSLRVVIGSYNPIELKSILRTIPDYESLSLNEILQCLAEGKFDTSNEDPAMRSVHMNLSGDLMPSFIDCVRMQGIEMDETIAEKYDILHDSWDLRDACVRKLHKLKKLIFIHGEEDPDLLAAIKDIEYLYSEKE